MISVNMFSHFLGLNNWVWGWVFGNYLNGATSICWRVSMVGMVEHPLPSNSTLWNMLVVLDWVLKKKIPVWIEGMCFCLS